MIDEHAVQAAQTVPWWYIPVLSGVLSAVCGGVASWFGGRLGVTWETKKLTKQRAFDYRLEWYMRLMRSLSEFKNGNSELRWYVRNKKDADQTRQVRDRVAQSALRFNSEFREAAMFAPASALGNLTVLKLAIEGILEKDNRQYLDATFAELDWSCNKFTMRFRRMSANT